jgi:hypothetical protein
MKKTSSSLTRGFRDAAGVRADRGLDKLVFDLELVVDVAHRLRADTQPAYVHVWPASEMD